MFGSYAEMYINKNLMHKDFLEWHTQKARLDSKVNRIFFHERDIWFTHLGANIGFEQDGRGDNFLRPVIILKKFNNEVLWAIPLTKTEKNNQAYYFPFSIKKNEKSTAILSQIRLIDSKRLKYKIGTINKNDFILLKRKIRQLVA